MPDNRIPQFPIGVLTPDSLFPIVSNGITSQIPFNHILTGALNYDKHLTGGTYNPSTGIATYTFNDNSTIDIGGYFEVGYTPEDVFNKQNSMDVDGSGVKYPTVDAVNITMNDIAKAILNTGFIDSNDSFFMSRLDDFTLAISGSNRGIIFKNILDTPPFAPATAILNIPDMVIPLSGISFTGDGIYIRFIGYNSDGNIVYSATSFQTSYDTAQLGVLILKVSGGTVSFEDATRNVINIPTIAGYSNFERTSLGLQSNITVYPNSGMTVNNTNGSLKGMSVNWHGINNDDKPFASSTATSFTHLSYANALTPTPVPFVSAVTTDQYWNGSALVNLSASTSATIQRWIVTINGTIALQYGEREYVDLTTARDNIATATFLDVIPKDTYAEIVRMAAISGTTNLSDTDQCIFVVTAGGNGNITNVSFWGEITGNISGQTDLFETFQVPVDNSFINLGTATTATTFFDLSTNRNYNVNITGNTTFNFISGPDGTENNLVINMPLPVNPTIPISGNVKWHGNVTQTINNLDGIKDTSFIISNGFPTAQANKLILQPDGKIIGGGGFQNYNLVPTNFIARINPNGNMDTDFTFYIGSGFNNTVQTLALQSDNKILCGGLFTQFYARSQNFITRLNTDGTLDTSFNIGSAFNQSVNIIVVQTGDSKILVGGSFTSYSGINNTNRLIRLNPDGTIDTSFSAGTGFNGQVNTIEFQSDNKLLVGGSYSRYQGTIIANNIIRLNPDGTYDSSFSGGVNNAVNSIKQQSDGKIFLGGQFTSASPIIAGGLLKMNYDETPDQPFQSNIGGGFSRTDGSSVTTWASVQQPDGKLVVLGDFTLFNNQPIVNVARLNADGTLDNTFSVGGTGFTTVFRSALAVQTDGKVLVGSQSTTFSGMQTGTLIRLTSGGTFDSSFASNIGTGFNGTNIVILAIQPNDNKILVGGQFTTFNGAPISNKLARLNPDGTRDTSFNIGTGFNNTVWSILLTPDNKILVGGEFTSYSGGTPVGNLLRLNLDGTRDITYSASSTFIGGSSQVLALALQTNGKIVVGGSFSQYSGFNSNGLFRLNPDGSRDITFSGATTGFNVGSSILQSGIAVQLDGKIVCGGGFSSYNGVSKSYYCRLNSDATLDTTFYTGSGFNFGLVQINTVQSSGETKLIVTGNFSTANGTLQGRITRLNSDGSLDNNFNVGGTGFNNTVRVVYEQLPHNRILVGGDFTTSNGTSKLYLTRLNLDGSNDTSYTPVLNNSVYTILQQPDNKIFIGGAFNQYNGIAHNRIARISASTDNNLFLKIKQEGTNIVIK